MRQTLWISLIVCAVTVGLAAQAPSSSPPQASKQVTFYGCVEKAPADEAVPPATASTTSTRFILTDASAAATGAVGTAGTMKPAAKYRLDADDAKLSPHVGHKVEVTGTIDDQPASGGAAASAAAGPKFKVESIKMVAATCK